jgi:hypothetical protein
MGDRVKKAIDDVKDNEVRHRTNAEIERVKREVGGEDMTVGEKVGSAVHEGVERSKAGIDKAKRDVRDHTQH